MQLELYIVDLIKNAFPDFQYSMSWFHLKMNARKQKSNSSSKVLKSFELEKLKPVVVRRRTSNRNSKKQ